MSDIDWKDMAKNHLRDGTLELKVPNGQNSLALQLELVEEDSKLSFRAYVTVDDDFNRLTCADNRKKLFELFVSALQENLPDISLILSASPRTQFERSVLPRSCGHSFEP